MTDRDCLTAVRDAVARLRQGNYRPSPLILASWTVNLEGLDMDEADAVARRMGFDGVQIADDRGNRETRILAAKDRARLFPDSPGFINVPTLDRWAGARFATEDDAAFGADFLDQLTRALAEPIESPFIMYPPFDINAERGRPWWRHPLNRVRWWWSTRNLSEFEWTN